MSVFISGVKFLHLFSLVVWVGTIVFFSFFAAPSIFKVLPRQGPGVVAGEVVGAIFPKYWLVGYFSGVLSVVTLLIVSYVEKSLPHARVFLLTLMTGVTFYSGLVVGKEAASIKADIKGAEERGDLETKEALREVFKKVHAKSSILNMTVLALGLVVVFLTAQRL